MKKFLFIFIIFLLNNCKPVSELIIEQPITASQADISPSGQTTEVFASRNLETIYTNKKKVKVALFLPFSGKNRDLGLALYNAATLSLFDNDANHNLELVLIDSKDNIVDTTKALQEVSNRNIKIIVGPIFSSSVNAIEKNILRNSITAISFSNNQELQDRINKNSAIFIAGFLPEQQIDKIVSFSISRNKTNFAILAPSSTYGLTTSKIFRQTVEDRDGTIIKSELYNPNSEKEIRASVKRIVESFLVPAKLAEGGGNKIDKNFKAKESDRSYPQVIFIPESGKMLSKIATLIKELNVQEREFQLIGIGQLDDIATLNDTNLKGMWFAAPDYKRFSSFERNYYQTFQKFPPRISSIAYDSIAAIAELVDKAAAREIKVEDFVNYEHTGINGFEGIDGEFRFLKNGLVQRNLAVLQVGQNDFETIEEANKMFLKY